MGFDQGFVESDERYYGIFICTICQSLVDVDDALVTTVCSHCFCRSCLQHWLERQQQVQHHQRQHHPANAITLNCPTCNRNLEYSSNTVTHGSDTDNGGAASQSAESHSLSSSSYARERHYYMMMGEHACMVQPLKSYQPLAHRVLRSLLVRCPLGHDKASSSAHEDDCVHCDWTGDYGSLQSHLLSATAHISQTQVSDSSANAATADGTAGMATGPMPQGSPSARPTKRGRGEVKHSHDASSDASSDNIPASHGGSGQQPQIVHPSSAGSDAGSGTGSDDKESTHGVDARPQNDQVTAIDRIKRLENKIKQQISLASSLKEEANNQFSNQHFSQARLLYKRAIDVLMSKDDMEYHEFITPKTLNATPSKPASDAASLLATLFCNRATTDFKLQQYAQCLQDSSCAIQWNTLYAKAYMRQSRAYLQLGRFEKAELGLQEGLHAFASAKQPNESGTQSLQKELDYVSKHRLSFQQATKQLELRQYATAKSSFGRLMKESIMPPCVLLGAAKADLGLGLTDAALTMTMRVLRFDSRNAEAFQIRGQAMFFMGDYEHGLKLMREALRLDPESRTIKTALKTTRQVHSSIAAAKQDMFHRRFQSAVDHITKALDICVPNPSRSPLYATLYTQRAEAYLRLKQHANCLKDCALVVYAQEAYIPAWLIKFQAYHGLGQHEDALSEVSDLLRRFESNDMRLHKAYEKADFEVRKQRRPDFYGTLGVSSLASLMEIKKAYKQQCLKYHPDRHSQKSVEEQKQAEKQFKILGDALETLSDDFKRKLYDEGYDPAAIRERVEAAEQAARRGRTGHGGHGHGHRHY